MPTARDPLADAAVAPVRSGMLVGLGTGRAAARGVRALAERVKADKLSITCVSTSNATTELATSLGLIIIDFASVDRIDFLFDGADEVDAELRMLKGGGGAMTRERIVASAASVRVNLIDHTKLVARLGTRMPLPIEVIPMALAVVTRQLRELSLVPSVRQRKDGTGNLISDNGNLILDCPIPDHFAIARQLDMLASQLDRTPGIIDHGLFIDEAQTILVESADGQTIRTLTRKARA
jgi:ribose 5-phosphate isomerase A